MVADVRRVLNSNKDPKVQGDIGEILSIEKGIDLNLATNLAETDANNLASIPASNTFTKGFDVVSGGNNPEFDKIFYNKETMSVEVVIEEKTSGDTHSRMAVKQAERHLDTIVDQGYDRIINDKWIDDDVINNISPSEFKNASVGAIVASGMDDSSEHEKITEKQVTEYNWSPAEFDLLNKVLKELKRQ